MEECAKAYVDAAASVSDIAADNLRRMFCSPKVPPKKVDTRRVVLDVGQGTTGTRSVAFAASLLGKYVLHFETYLLPNGTFGHRRKKIYSKWQSMKRTNAGCHEWLDHSLNFLDDETKYYDMMLGIPSSNYGTDMLRYTPNAHILVTERNFSDWYRARRRDHNTPPPPYQRPCEDKVRLYTEEQSSILQAADIEYWKCKMPPERITFLNVFEESSTVLWTKLARALEVNITEEFMSDNPFPTTWKFESN
uniref:Sulfotransferase domain-containing protein n=1 Tax=Compsopogon caeruleus TaxID=31354 RepID=A0A7S1T9X6_9RHOD